MCVCEGADRTIYKDIVVVPQSMKHLIKQRTAHLHKPIAAPCLPRNIFTGYDISGRVRIRKVKRIKPVISPVTQVKIKHIMQFNNCNSLTSAVSSAPLTFKRYVISRRVSICNSRYCSNWTLSHHLLAPEKALNVQPFNHP